MSEQATVIDFRISMWEAFKFGSGFGIGFFLSPFTMLLWGLGRVVSFPIRWWLRRGKQS